MYHYFGLCCISVENGAQDGAKNAIPTGKVHFGVVAQHLGQIQFDVIVGQQLFVGVGTRQGNVTRYIGFQLFSFFHHLENNEWLG